MKIFKKKYDENYFDTLTEKFSFEKIFNKNRAILIRSQKPSGNLLEIGCGRGALLNEFKDNYSIKGIDISPSAIKEASKLIKKPFLEVKNIEKKKIKGKYDVIIAFDVLEHLKNPKKAIDRIRKALKKNGVFIFSVPNNYGLFGKIATLLFNYIDRTHISTYKRKKWISIMKKSKFKINIYNEHHFGISSHDFMKHFSFNLIIVGSPIN